MYGVLTNSLCFNSLVAPECLYGPQSSFPEVEGRFLMDAILVPFSAFMKPFWVHVVLDFFASIDLLSLSAQKVCQYISWTPCIGYNFFFEGEKQVKNYVISPV